MLAYIIKEQVLKNCRTRALARDCKRVNMAVVVASSKAAEFRVPSLSRKFKK